MFWVSLIFKLHLSKGGRIDTCYLLSTSGIAHFLKHSAVETIHSYFYFPIQTWCFSNYWDLKLSVIYTSKYFPGLIQF